MTAVLLHAACVAPAALIHLACAGPAPKLFPAAPIDTRPLADGGTLRRYDTDGDGRADVGERLSADGRIVALYDAAATARWDKSDTHVSDVPEIRLDGIPPADRNELFIILDSVPYAVVRETRERGRFRFFHPPARVIAPFPVMTDLALAEFFGISPCAGVESAYYDGETLTNGYFTYASDENTPWHRFLDYRLNPVMHGTAYLHPRPWFDHELRRIQECFLKQDRQRLTAYCVGTSALGAMYGRNGHQTALVQLDRLCQALLHARRGRIRITLMSDHGHNLVSSRRLPLAEFLSRCGYRVTKQLEKTGDVVVPQFGVVTCAAIHTHEPVAVARDVVGAEGVDLAACLAPSGEVRVFSRDGGEARITRRRNAYHYHALAGDPLQLTPILARLREAGRIDADGFIDDETLFQATRDHVYPDAVRRLWRAFHGLIAHTPDVFVSIRDGWHWGSRLMSRTLDLAAAHGSLNRLSSSGFVMTTAGELPPVVRMDRLRAVLKTVNVSVPGAEKAAR